MKPLEGIRVLDMGRFVSAPFCGMLLADMGAEVIKIEKPGRGEDTRNVGPFMNGKSLYVPTFNRNKKGITLQTRSEDGIRLLKKLICNADVLIENFRPGTMKKMGLGFDAIQELNPRIIMASISGYGQTGPDAEKPAFDPVAQAMGGLYAITGTESSGPLGTGTVIADLTTGLYTAYAILAALLHREKTGKGKYIDIAMTDCVVSMLHTYVANYSANGIIQAPHGNRDPLSVPADCYQTKDGYVVMHAGDDKPFKLLKELLGDARMENPKFDTHQGRIDCRDELEGYVQEWFKGKTAEEAEQLLAGKGIISSVVNDIPHLLQSKQLQARGAFVELEVPGAGMCTFQASPIKFSDATVTYQRAPMVGEHNEEIYKNLLGLDSAQMRHLIETGVI